jgi:lipopolysaccharide heptosyltransferase I
MAATDSLPLQRVLIIRPSALGDVSRTVPALVALRRAYPDAEIDWLIQDSFLDAISHHPALSGIVPFPREKFRQTKKNPRVASEAIRWSMGLAQKRYDVAYDLQGLFRSGLFTMFTFAKRRVGFANARELGWLGYNRRHRVDPKLHTVDRMLALLAAEGIDTSQPDMRLYTGGAEEKWLEELRAEKKITGRFFTIAPTARWRSKCWPIERYVEVTKRLLDSGRAGDRGFVLASPRERPHVQPLLDAFHGERGPLLAPATTVGQMMAILGHTSLLICNDSAPLHVAVGFDRPIATIFGPTDPALVGPYRRPECVARPAAVIAGGIPAAFRRNREDQSLIAQVEAEAVWRVIEEQLR